MKKSEKIGEIREISKIGRNGAGAAANFDGVRVPNDDRRENLCGRTLGDYRIERRVGGGATSDVFLATQLSLGRPVALKLLKDDLANDETYLKRFLQEARAAARLEHPNIVRIYEVGTLVDVGDAKDGRRFWRRFPFSRRGASRGKSYRFIAQEYVEGTNLQRYMRLNGRPTIPQTFAALEQIAAALKRAADAGVVHRDVKPENVLLDANGTIKVVDFGLAQISNALDSVAATALTRAGFALGTPLYMSPEQARGKDVDSRSDIYSLGVVAYRMLTGRPPFDGETPLAVVLKHLNEKPRPILELNPDAPAALAALVERSLAKNPNDRPASPDLLIAELRAARRECEREAEARGENPFAPETDAAASTVSAFAIPDKSVETNGFELNSASGAGNVGKSEIGSVGDSSERATVVSNAEPEPEADDAAAETVGATTFFRTEEERENFRRSVAATNVSREWRSNRTKLLEAATKPEPIWTVRRGATAAVVALLAILSGGVAVAARNRWVESRDVEPPSTVRKFETVEEQWVFAAQLGTVDAWKSVCEYFPNDEYWRDRATRQLALAYVNEKNVAEAGAIFEELASKPAAGREFDPLGLAGLAWRAANENDVETAVAKLSELRSARATKYDRLTEVVVERAQEIVRAKIGGGTDFGDSDARRAFDRSFGARPDSQFDERRDVRPGGRFDGGERGGRGNAFSGPRRSPNPNPNSNPGFGRGDGGGGGGFGNGGRPPLSNGGDAVQ